MNDKLFAELMASIEEAGHIVREETAPSRTFTVEARASGCGGHPGRLQAVANPVCCAAGHQRQDSAQLGTGAAYAHGPRRAFSCKWQQNTLMPCGMSYTPMSSDVPPPPAIRMADHQFTAVAVDRIAELLETLVTLGQAARWRMSGTRRGSERQGVPVCSKVVAETPHPLKVHIQKEVQ